MKQLFLLLFVLSAFAPLYGQSSIIEDEYYDEDRVGFPTYRVGFSPSGFLNSLPRIQFSGDYGFFDSRMNVGIDVGYIFRGRDFLINRRFASDNENSKGISTRLSIDYTPIRKRAACFFFGLSYMVRSSAERHNEWQNFPNEGYARYSLRKDTYLFHGLCFHLGSLYKLDEKIYVETSIGAGSGSMLIDTFFDGNKIDNRSQDLNWPILYWNINFGYAL